MAEDKRTEEENINVENQSEEELESQKDRKKMRMLIGGAIAILTIAVVVLAGCMIYSQNLNHKLASKTSELQEEYKKLQASIEESAKKPEAEPEPTVTEEPTPTPTEEPTPGPVTDNLDAVEQNMQQFEEGQQGTDTPEPTPEGEGDKVINTPDNPEQFATFEGYIEGKKYTFQYPSEWDGRVIFANVTNEDGTVVVTCYQNGQFADNQNGAAETGEIFHILINKDPLYQSPSNDQYKIAEKDGYCAYYEEPAGVTYDYINHKEYAQDYKMVYESQAKVWRTFQFN